jgi:peptide/nickel transport system permease protein
MADVAADRPGRRPAPSFAARAARHRSFAIGAALTAAMIAMALVSLVWTPHSPTQIYVKNMLQPPSATHWFGTDQFGRDIVSMIMAGAQTSIVVGVVAVGIGIVGGSILGLFAAALRGWVEEAIMRLTDFTYAFPAILVAILITAAWSPGIVNAIVAIGIANIAIFARVVRGAANAIWAREFVLAARAAGRSRTAITASHILPNITSVIVVQATIQFAIAILAEAALSYLGLGTQPPEPSWGRMLSEAQNFILFVPMLAVYPGLAIVLAVLGLNLLGDGLRDLLDPRLARQR